MKRDHDQPTTKSSPCINETAIGMSLLSRKIILITQTEDLIDKPPQTSHQAAEQKPPTHEMLYWRQTAETLLNENRGLRESLQRKETECAELINRIRRTEQTCVQLEQQLASHMREVLILRADRITPPPPPKRTSPIIPLNTQGKDAIYWHQACRTLQSQYMELQSELESKTDQFLRLTERLTARP